jgi:hypothetical protein
MQMSRDLFELLVVDPDDARVAGAAVAALRAGETQTILVPGTGLTHSSGI